MNKLACQPIKDTVDIINDPTLYNWLKAKAKQYELQYLLAHAEDGIIWGHFREQNYQLVTSGDDDVFPRLTKLRLCTLQQCRIFGKNTEVMLWKVGQYDWKARSVEDKYLSKEDYIPEDQILWGTKAEKESNGFTLVSDGSQGLKHAVPLRGSFKDQDSRPLRLKVRHYIDYDESGVARIYLSRLVDLYFDSNP